MEMYALPSLRYRQGCLGMKKNKIVSHIYATFTGHIIVFHFTRPRSSEDSLEK